MALNCLGQYLTREVSAESASEDFKKLGDAYQYNAKITGVLLAHSLDNLEDVRTAFSSYQELAEKVFKGIQDLPQPLKNGGRLKPAWEAAGKANYQQAALIKRGPEALDPEALLPTETLNSSRGAFYARYHIQLSAASEPSDVLLGKVSNQLKHRLLQVVSVWKVRTLAPQVMQDTKRRQLAGGLEVVQEQLTDVVHIDKHVHNYLECLHTLRFAYVRVGCAKLPNPPKDDAGKRIPETRSQPSWKYVEVPH